MLKIEGLKKNYGAFALDCSLEIRPGCVTGLIGQNGAGKSTTFKGVLGLIRPDSGTVRVLGQDSRTLGKREKQQLGVVLSDSGFSGYLTVKDIVPVLESLYEKFDKPFFLEQLRKFGLPDNKKIKEFSTGMKVKLKVLVAVSHDARLLILDEPTAGLDVVARDELLESLCDDVYMIHQGKIILHEDTDTLLDEYALLKIDERQFDMLDKRYVLRCKKESFGYSCLTDQKRYYMENYPKLTIEKGSIDNVITMMIRGAAL